MAQERYTRTNQKIYFAGLAHESWRKALQSEAVDASVRVQAEREACLFHLQGALLGLCHEVIGYYRFEISERLPLEVLISPAVLEKAQAPELAELRELRSDNTSWLSLIVRHWQQVQYPVFEVEQLPAPDIQEVESWRAQLKALILRFRQTMTEW